MRFRGWYSAKDGVYNLYVVYRIGSVGVTDMICACQNIMWCMGEMIKTGMNSGNVTHHRG